MEITGGAMAYNISQIPMTPINITNTLIHCSTNNLATQGLINELYVATITPEQGYTLVGATVSIIMNNVNVTDTVYNNGVININKITGNISISITAVENIEYTPDNYFTIENGVVTGFSTLGQTAYNNGLTVLKFSPNLTKFNFGPAMEFENLKGLWFYGAVTNLNGFVFGWDGWLTEGVKFFNTTTPPTLESNGVFALGWDAYNKVGTIYVPAGSVEDYKTAWADGVVVDPDGAYGTLYGYTNVIQSL